ncbi:MAG TPA: hypothetical protein VIV60_23840 [Polyangiaceae bacterium]
MKPWFVVVTLWALSGMVALRTAYADDFGVRNEPAAIEPQAE